MYLEFFRLDRAPFHITPDPDFLFPSPSHNEALAAIVYGVEKRKGFVALTGEVGTGKTTILRAYLRREEGTDIRPIYLFHPDLSFRDLVIKLLRELGMETGEGSTSEFLERLQVQLIDEYRSNRTPVLIIDEAQNMPNDTLEQLRMLTNLETSKDKLMQVVLVGQPELEEILDQHSLRQLKQRIAVRATIQPLTPTEAVAYVRSRAERAGGDAKYLFTNAAIKEIARLSKGIPRTVNTLCDNALIAGYGLQQRPVSVKTVREAARDLQLKVDTPSLIGPRTLAWALAAIAAIVAGGFVFSKVLSSPADDPEAYAMTSETATSQTPGINSTQIDADVSASSLDAVDVETDAPAPPDVGTKLAATTNEPEPVDVLTKEIRELTIPREEIETGGRPIEVDVVPVEMDAVDDAPMVDVPTPVAAVPLVAETPSKLPPVSTKPPVVEVTPNTTSTLPDRVAIATRVVKPGDCLSKLIAEVYKTENYQSLMQNVIQHNPGISDPDALPVGLSINFPALTRAQAEAL